MPRSRRRRSARQSIFNKIRGAGRTAHALELARAASAHGHPETINWALRTLRIDGPLSSLQPRRLSQLHVLPQLEPLPLKWELSWVRALLELYAPYLNSGLAYRVEVEDRLVANDGDETLRILDAWEGDIGPSLSLIAIRLATLQITRGLEAQKGEFERIRTANVAQNLRFFSYWWSVRAEDGSSWRNFARDFERRLKMWDIDDSSRAHIGFQLLGHLPPPGSEALLLSTSMLGSALDVYEAFLAMARAAIIEARPSRDAFADCCMSLSKHIDDHRLAKLTFLSGDLSAAASMVLAPTILRDAALAGGPASDDPALDIAELFCSPTKLAAPASRNSLPGRVLRAVEDFASPGGAYRGTAELQKLGAMFDHLPLGSWLTHSAARQQTEPLDPNRTAQLFAASRWLEPETLGALNAAQLAALDTIHNGLPTTPSWLWYQAINDQRACADVLDRLSPMAAAELVLAEAQRGNDPHAILAAVHALNKITGSPTRSGLRAEIEAVLAIEGLAAALALATSYLLPRPELAAWLPLDGLAAAIQEHSLPASNIDVPIILDFAAKNVDSALAPHRTYAAEDYLLTCGAAHPADLCAKLAPNEATQQQFYFFGEVCVPSSLRTSTIFDNERELESDRIAVCRWLAATTFDDSERFEEEARELVRARHIQLGVQALQGSKLSVDWASLRRWAERSVAEDFKRYMDLLEQGIFSPDQQFREQVFAAIEAGVDTESLEIPKNEAAELFASLTSALMREFALHPEHGLDAYLSLRIRHGTLSGHLRGPAEREHLVTRRDATGCYHQNDYWTKRLHDALEISDLELVDDLLQILSSRLDGLIEVFTQDLIQVRREERPKGVLATDPSSSMITLMIAETLPGQSFDDFFFRCEEAFWGLVRSCKTQIDASLTEMKGEAEQIFDAAERDVRAVAAFRAGSLIDSLLRARANVLLAIDEIGDWLTPPETPASLLLSVEELVRVSLAVIRGFYNDFEPEVTFDIANPSSLPGAVRLFSDIFFIIFENVLKYSGNPVDPSICVRAWVEDDQIRFRVENSVEAVTAEDRERIANAKERIANGSFRRAVRGEGGTGLPKLAKVIGHGSGGGELSFDLTDDDKKFVVDFSLRLLDITPAAEEQP